MADESKEDRFVRLAEKRVNRIIDGLRLLRQASNRNNYSYTDQQVSKIFREIRKAVRESEDAFTGRNQAEKQFRL